MGNNIFITGSGNKVAGDCENITALGCTDMEFTSADNGKVFMLNTQVISEDGVIPTKAIRTADFSTATTKAKIFFVDASGGANITVTLVGSGAEYIFIKTDASANTVIITPDTGLINGGATHTLTTQYQRAHAVWDGTDWYV